MSSTLLLKLAGPLQSWGDSSHFNRRMTRREPTKSGILGLLAAASGRRRSDPIEDLLELQFGVRTDQPGALLRDFHTEIDWRTGKSKPLTHRYYLADAVFIAGIEGDDGLLSALHEALLRPYFPLYLGRRSCPPSERIVLGLRDISLDDALLKEPWQASKTHRRSQPRAGVSLPIIRDCKPGEKAHESFHDVPLSFDTNHRRYGWRDVVHTSTPPFTNPDGRPDYHDPFALMRSFDVSDEA